MKLHVFTLLSYHLIIYNLALEPSNNETNKPPQCRTEIKSICPNNKVSRWNRINVSKELKKWIRSVSVQWEFDRYIPNDNSHCKMFTMKPNYFFYQFAPDATSLDVMIIGNVEPPNETSKSINTKFQRPKIIGSIWADMHNGHEWNIKEIPRKRLSAHVSSDAILGNGLYYGVLNNNQLRLGE